MQKNQRMHTTVISHMMHFLPSAPAAVHPTPPQTVEAGVDEVAGNPPVVSTAHGGGTMFSSFLSPPKKKNTFTPPAFHDNTNTTNTLVGKN